MPRKPVSAFGSNELLAEEKHFEMTPAQFRRFCRALDKPRARSLKAMRRLLNEPGVLDNEFSSVALLKAAESASNPR